MDAESVANATELMENLKKILNMKQSINFEIKTPPQSPPICELLKSNILQSKIKTEVEDVEIHIETSELEKCSIIKDEISESIKHCRNCEQQISLTQTTPIEETMSRLGLTPPEDV